MSMWLQPLVAIVLPALLIAAVPQRWVKRTVIFWLLSPLIVFAGAVILEIATRPATPNALGTAFYGLMLVSSILAIPWLVVCLIGFGIGFGLRRLLRARSAEVRTVEVPALPIAATPAPAAPTRSAWRDVHVGFAHDGLQIGGLGVWEYPWRPTGCAPVKLPHPAHLAQIHSYDIYTINDERYQVRFAAAELSNGVWGFYVST